MNGAAILAVTCLMSASLAFAEKPTYAGPVEAKEVRVRDGIGHVVRKLRSGQPVSIAYFGGSITEADGWRRLSREWLQQTYPGSAIREIPAAIGGTDSGLGVFRFRRDVLSHKPDLIFVEFATNDSGLSPETIWERFDGFIRQAWQADPETDFVFVYTITSPMMGDYGVGKCPCAASAMEQIADHYGIPSIGFGPRVAAEVKAGRLVMSLGEVVTAVPKAAPDRDAQINAELEKQGKMLFARDGTHPALPGHGLYLKSVQAAWKDMEGLPPADHAKKLAAPFYSARLEAATMVPIAAEMCRGSWKKLPPDDPNQRNFEKRGGQMWMTGTPGDKLVFRFRGSECGLYDVMGPDCGQLLIKVDGVPWRTPRSRFDSFCTYYRLAGFTVFRGEEGIHEVEIEVDRKQPDRKELLTRHPEEDVSLDKYNGTKFFVCQIEIVGELIK